MAGVLGAASGCGRHSAPAAKADAAPRPVPVTVGVVATRPVVRTVEMVGTLKGWEEVTVGSKRAGRVVKILHDMGDRVGPGEPLLELDPVDAELGRHLAESQYLGELVKLGVTAKQADEFVARFGTGEELLRGEVAKSIIESVPAVLQQRASRDKALTDLNRQRQLSQRGAGSPQELQDVESAYRTAQAAYDNAMVAARSVIASAVAARVSLDQARQVLDDVTIRTPVPSQLPDGLSPGSVEYAVTQRSVSEGQMLAVGEAVFDLVIEDPLRLWGQVPERSSGQVEVGQEAEVRVSAFDRPFPGRVARINPAVDPVSRTFQVEVAVPNADRRLRPGGFAKASIITRRDDEALVVRRDAVAQFAGVTKVFVLEGEGDRAYVRPVNVTTGQEGEGWIEVGGELAADWRVAESGLGKLADGTSVLVRDPIADAAPEADDSAADGGRGASKDATAEPEP